MPNLTSRLANDTGVSSTDRLTDDPTLTGTAEAGAFILFSENGALIGSTIADIDGNWTYVPTLGDGAHTIEVEADGTDTSFDTVVFTLDTGTFVTASLVDDSGRLSTDHITNDPSLHGHADAGATITFSEAGTALGATSADINGDWTFTPVLADGAHTVHVLAADPAGNTVSADIAMQLQTAPPPIDAALSNVTGSSGYTADPTLSGTTDPGDTVTVYEVVQPTRYAITSLFSTGVDGAGAALVDGASDSHYQLADFVSGAIHAATVLDSVALSIDYLVADTTSSSWIIAGDTGAGLYDYRTTFDLTGDDPSTAIIQGAWAVDGVSSVFLNGQFTGITSFYDRAALTSFTIASGFVSGVNVLDFYVINTVDQAFSGLQIQLAGTVALAGQAQPTRTTLGSVVADNAGDWTYTPTLADGPHDLLVVATDTAGNVASTQPIHLVLATTPPPLSAGLADDTGVSVGDGITSDPALAGVTSAGATVALSEAGVSLGSAVADAAGHWAFMPTLGDGAHLIDVVATDLAGNSASATAGFTLLTAQPALTAGLTDITGPNGSNATSDATIGGTTTPGATVTLSEAFTPVPQAIATLFGTGVDSAGVPLAGNAADPHYTVTFLGDGSTVVPTALDPNSYPLGAGGPYAADTSSASWIAPASTTVGYYIYHTTFSLAGLDPATAAITGSWAVDDVGAIVLNGQYTGISDYYGLGQHTAFTIGSGFVAGLNTLDFYTVNVVDSPTGLLVDLQGTAAPDAATLAAQSVLGTTVADSSGNWSITPALPDGNHDIVATATDLAGNTVVAPDVDFTLDSNLTAIPPSQPNMAFLASTPPPPATQPDPLAVVLSSFAPGDSTPSAASTVSTPPGSDIPPMVMSPPAPVYLGDNAGLLLPNP